LEDNATVVEFAKQDQRDLVAWITRHFLANQKRISTDLCVYLIEITGGTMTALSGEIKKICAYSGAEIICRADIDAVTEPVMDAVIYQLTDRLGIGDYSGALQTLQVLLKMQEDPIKILGSIGSHFRRLSAARILQEYGKTYSDLRRLAGYSSDYPAKKAMEAARRFKPEFCARASELILETDHKMKTSFDDQERLLELLILQLAQEAKHG
jgi:DNA polymerase-3 subunit delta